MGAAIAPQIVTGAFTAGVALVGASIAGLNQRRKNRREDRLRFHEDRLTAAAELIEHGSALDRELHRLRRRNSVARWNDAVLEARAAYYSASARFRLVFPADLVRLERDLTDRLVDYMRVPVAEDDSALRPPVQEALEAVINSVRAFFHD
jgi:hypothetical protein